MYFYLDEGPCVLGLPVEACILGFLAVLFLWHTVPPLLGGVLGGIAGGLLFQRVSPLTGGILGSVVCVPFWAAGLAAWLPWSVWETAKVSGGALLATLVVCFALSRVMMLLDRGGEASSGLD